MNGTLVITDGTTRIDLLNTFCLYDWTPALPQTKGGGVWSESPFSPGRQLAMREYSNVIDVFELKAKGQGSIDQLIFVTQELRRLLEKATAYWTSSYQSEPVWIETRGICETNTRYAVIKDWQTPTDDNPFSAPTITNSIFDNWTLIIEHGFWQANEPGTGSCIETAGYGCFCHPNYLSFDGANDYIDFGSGANIDDLPVGANGCTIEAWVYREAFTDNSPRIFDKSVADGWLLYFDHASDQIVFEVYGAVANSVGYVTGHLVDTWYHVAATFFDVGAGGDGKAKVYLNGIKGTDGAVLNGAYQVDNARTLYCGGDAANSSFNGNIGWVRLSSFVRYAADFGDAIPPRCKFPDNDGNSELLAICEGTGNATYDRSGNGNNGTLTNGPAWACDCCDEE